MGLVYWELPSGYVKIAIENGHGNREFSHLTIVMFHSYVNVYQRVYGNIITIFAFVKTWDFLHRERINMTMDTMVDDRIQYFAVS